MMTKGLVACYEKSKERLKYIRAGHDEKCSYRMANRDGLCECLVKYPRKLIKNKASEIHYTQPVGFCGVIANEYHVDSRIRDGVMIGSDDNPGTRDKPLATIPEAIRRIKV